MSSAFLGPTSPGMNRAGSRRPRAEKALSSVKILILTMHDNEEFVRQAMTGKADGFILKEEPSSELIRAIIDIRNGKKYFSPRLSEALLSFATEEEPSESLSNREKRSLAVSRQGHENAGNL
jgi:DNA-binding NarL/FixJ family response regulator